MSRKLKARKCYFCNRKTNRRIRLGACTFYIYCCKWCVHDP